MMFSKSNRNPKKIVWMLIAILILSFTIIKLIFMSEVWKNQQIFEHEKPQVTIERIDQSIKSDDGHVLAYIYYDKPVVKNSKYSKELNRFFEEEEEGWFNGTNRLTLNSDNLVSDFRKVAAEDIDELGVEALKEQPLLCTVDSEVVFQSDQYLSIRHIVTVQKLGKGSWFYFGSNFDLKTGELLPMDKLVNINADDFRSKIFECLTYSNILEYNHNTSLKELEEVYGSKGNGSYMAQVDGENIDLRYEYYFDKDSIYLIMNHETFFESGVLMKWNGKLGDAFKAEFMGYIKNGDKFDPIKYQTNRGTIDYSQYLKKIWVVESNNYIRYKHSSFYITKIENGKIEGKFSASSAAWPDFYFYSLAPDNYLGDLTGTVKNGVAECQFIDKVGNKGVVTLVFNNSNEINAIVAFTHKSDALKDIKLDETNLFRPYNRTYDKEFTESEDYSFSVDLNSWGDINFVSGEVNTGDEIFPAVCLTNKEGDILYVFSASFHNGSKVIEASVKDLNNDGFKDVRIVTAFNDSEIEPIEWVFFQMEDGLFYRDDLEVK